jgi:hypothetical protein
MLQQRSLICYVFIISKITIFRNNVLDHISVLMYYVVVSDSVVVVIVNLYVDKGGVSNYDLGIPKNLGLILLS